MLPLMNVLHKLPLLKQGWYLYSIDASNYQGQYELVLWRPSYQSSSKFWSRNSFRSDLGAWKFCWGAGTGVGLFSFILAHLVNIFTVQIWTKDKDTCLSWVHLLVGVDLTGPGCLFIDRSQMPACCCKFCRSTHPTALPPGSTPYALVSITGHYNFEDFDLVDRMA